MRVSPLDRILALGGWTCSCGAVSREGLRSKIPVSWLAICVACEEIAEILPMPLEDDDSGA